MSRNLRVPGHALLEGGWGHSFDLHTMAWRPNPQAGGSGHAVCTCGAYSPPLPSQGKRVKWMREIHKIEVLEARPT